MWNETRCTHCMTVIALVAGATLMSACGSDQSAGSGPGSAADSPSGQDGGGSDATLSNHGGDPHDGGNGSSDTGSTPPPSGGDDGGGTTTDGSTPPPAGGLRFVAFGDSRDNPQLHQGVLDAMSKMSPQLILDTGDLWAGYPNSSTQWASITTSNPNIAALLNGNMYLVSRGNHESKSELLAFKPTLVRNNSETYSFAVGNAFFVSVGMDPAAATTFLSQELSSAAATAATWRFVYSHYPIYDSGDGHGPVKGIPAVEALCDKYHVAAFFSGHEHIYERFNQIAGGKVVDTSDAMKASKGTVYLVSGGAGAPFYSVTTPLPQEHVNKTDVNHYMLVDLTATTMTVQALDTTNTVIDHFQISQ